MEGCGHADTKRPGLGRQGELMLPHGFRLWAVATDSPDRREDDEILAACERERGARLARPADRRAFVKTRAALRRKLGAFLDASPSELRFSRNPWGQMVVMAPAQRGGPAPWFSVSHAQGLSLIALSPEGEVGVDLERVRPVAERDAIVAGVFGPQVARDFLAIPEAFRDGAFLELWTAGEAYAKARGLGLAGLGGPLPVSLSPGGTPQLRESGSREGVGEAGWRLYSVALPKDFVGNLVVRADDYGGAVIVPEELD